MSLTSAVSTKLINLFSSSSSSGSSVSLSSSSSTSLSSSLRLGAQTFASSIQILNSTISFLNTTKEDLEEILKITGKVISLAENGGSRSTSSEARKKLAVEFHRLGGEYRRVVDNATIGDYDVLSKEDIAGALELVGLDKATSDSIAAIFKKFSLSGSDDSLASDHMTAPKPIHISPSAFLQQVIVDGSTTTMHVPRRAPEGNTVFDENRELRHRVDWLFLLADVKELNEQVRKNLKAIDYGLDVIGENIDLIRGAGFAFLDISNQLKGSEEAEEVVKMLQQQIRQNASAALAQAENLNPIVVATLTIMSEGLTYRKD